MSDAGRLLQTAQLPCGCPRETQDARGRAVATSPFSDHRLLGSTGGEGKGAVSLLWAAATQPEGGAPGLSAGLLSGPPEVR